MARPLRLEYPGAFYHITSRGNAREDIFVDKKDFSKFLDLLGYEVVQQGWKCFAYCLMNNHFHLLIETPEPNLAKGMSRLNGSYSQYFNRKNGRVGHLFQGRYKSIIVDKDNYLLELCRYIVLNPVRAGIVKKPEQWNWSSYRATLGKESGLDWFYDQFVLEQFSKTRRRAMVEYKRFVNEGIGEESPWKDIKGQIWLGREEFVKKIQKYIDKEKVKGIPDVQINPLRPGIEEIISKVAKLYGTSEKDIRNRNNKEAYRVAVYLLRRVSNIGIREVADIFGISGAMVSKIQRELKDKKTQSVYQKLLKKYKVKP